MKSELEYIESELLQLNRTITVSHRVYLGHKSHDNKRINYMKLFNYSTKKYDNIDLLTACNLNLTNMLLFKYKHDDIENVHNETKFMTFFGISDLPSLYRFINVIDAWFNSKDFSDMYTYENNILVLNKKYERTYIECVTDTYRDYSMYIIRAKPLLYRDPINASIIEKAAGIYIGTDATYITCLTNNHIQTLKLFMNTYNISIAGSLILNNALLSMQRYSQIQKT